MVNEKIDAMECPIFRGRSDGDREGLVDELCVEFPTSARAVCDDVGNAFIPIALSNKRGFIHMDFENIADQCVQRVQATRPAGFPQIARSRERGNGADGSRVDAEVVFSRRMTRRREI